ncbi:MAG: MFS transporter [Chloroflexota bacterium]|nr:MFS transporter [Chloroflexota bacterium]MDE2920530.1 MFS transporter [Chloroflexota bacterium]
MSRGLTAFAYPTYRVLWLSSTFTALGTWAERLAVGWLVLVETESVLLSAATFAVRSAPGILAAPLGGAVADRYPRTRLLPITALIRAVLKVLLALIAWVGFSNPWPIFLLIALGGVVNSFDMPGRQGLITDLVPREVRMNAISLHAVGSLAVGAIGALASGITAELLGIPAALAAAAVLVLIGGAIVLLIPNLQPATRDRQTPLRMVFQDTADGIRLMAGLPVVATLLLMAIAVEIFGFAYQSVMPAMARGELQVTESGLGTLQFAAGMGAVAGAVALSLLGDFRRKGRLLLSVTMVYGLGLVGVALSPSLAVAITLVTLVGAMAAAFDAIQLTLLQATVPDEMRGRVVGGWLFAIGFGWVGHLAMGAVGEAVGVRWAIGGAGLVVVLAGLLILAASPMLRRM